MSDWDFLHEMDALGYSQSEIMDAAGTGLAPWDYEYLDRDWVDDQLNGELEENANSIKPFISRQGLPFSILEQSEILYDLVDCASRHFENTGRFLQVWGELGEIYAEIKFGLCRHSTHTRGSDGTIEGKLVEVKTISPEKSNNRVTVKSHGDFEQLLIVGIDKNFNFRGKLVNRSELKIVSEDFLMGVLEDDSCND